MGDVAQAKLLRGLGLATVAIALVHLFALSLPSLLANSAVYRSLWAQIAAFVTLTAVILSVGAFHWRERPLGRVRWILLAVSAVTAVVALVGIPSAYLTHVAEWSFGVTCWAGLLLLMDFSFAASVAFLAGYLGLRLGLLAAAGQADHPSVAGALNYASVFLAIQLAIAFVGVLLRRMAIVAAGAANDEERTRTAEAVAEQLHSDRQERFAGLDTVPLLTGLAAGVLDPADEQVRIRCAVEAARIRRLFAESDVVPDRLVHELRACLDTAERKGVSVYFGTCGLRPGMPLRVRRALTEPVLALLATAVSEARITVIGAATTVTVSVVTDGDLPHVIPATDEITVTRLAHGGRHWVEATWQAAT
jgi:hypothetical protein